MCLYRRNLGFLQCQLSTTARDRGVEEPGSYLLPMERSAHLRGFCIHSFTSDSSSPSKTVGGVDSWMAGVYWHTATWMCPAFAGAFAPTSHPLSCSVLPALSSRSAHLTSLPVQVPVELSFGEGQKKDV